MFFFSSRRRHTRSDRDWSSDVCSSDLAPFVRNGETAPENEQRHKRGKMCVGRGEQHRAENHSDKAAKVAFEYAVNEKPKNKLLDNGCDGDRKHNDHYPLLDRARSTEEL